MKKVAILLLVFISNATQAQLIFTEFFTKDGKLTDKENSYYYQVGEKVIYESQFMGRVNRDTLYADTVKTFYSGSGRLRSRTFYVEGIRHGSFAFFHENGMIKERGRYYKDKKVGYISSWYSTGLVEKNLKYIVDENKFLIEDSFQIINYWDASNQQIIKNGNGYCNCSLNSDFLIEKGKIVDGYRDSTWQFFINDTLRYEEEFDLGQFIRGKSFYQGGEIVYTKREIQAEMPGGFKDLFAFISKNLKYPVYAKRMGVEGKVYIKFIVEKDGAITNTVVSKGVHKSLDEEALRVVNLFEKWTPAKLRGIPVKSQFVMPIMFKLDY